MSDEAVAFHVRVASLSDPDDVAALGQLRFAWRSLERGEGGLGAEEFAPQFATWCRDHARSHVGFLATRDDRPVAMAWLALVDRVPGPGIFQRRCAYVQSVYVDPDSRNRGWGSRLMEVVVEHARFLALDYLAVHPSAESFPFYRRLGFDPTTRVLELDFRAAP